MSESRTDRQNAGETWTSLAMPRHHLFGNRIRWAVRVIKAWRKRIREGADPGVR